MNPIEPGDIGRHEFQDILDTLDDVLAARVLQEYQAEPCAKSISEGTRRAGFHAVLARVRARLAPAPAAAAAAGSVRELQHVDLERVGREGIPPRDWILPGWIIRKDIVLMAGGAGIGKSTTASAAAVALAKGEPWLGIEPSEALRVIYVDEEMGEDESTTLFLQLGGIHPNLFLVTGQGVRIDTDQGAAELEAKIRKHDAQVVFLDGTQQTFGSVSRKDSGEIAAVYARLYRLRDQYGVTFVLLGPKRKDYAGQPSSNKLEMVLDSVAFGTSSSTVWFCERGGPDQLNITQVKRRGGTETSIVACYECDGQDGPITLTAGGSVADHSGQISGCSEWVVRLVEESGADTLKAEFIHAAAARLDHPYPKRTVQHALDHAVSMKRLTRPKRGWYQSANGTAATA